jgi:hypothetical protein
MDELVTPVATQLQQNCSSGGQNGEEAGGLTPPVAVNQVEAATGTVTLQGLEP